MSKVVATFKCKMCNDIFEASSDAYSSCSCGKNSVKPSEWSTSYLSREGKGMNFERLESKVYYCEDEYLALNDKANYLWDKIRNLKIPYKKIGDHFTHYHLYNHVLKDRSADGREYPQKLVASVISSNKYNEENELHFEYNLKREKKY